MTKFKAKVVRDIPANRLIALGGINSDGNPEEGWETIYLKLSELGWIPDFVTNSELEEGSVVNVTIANNPIWRVESAQNLPAGTLVMCDEVGRVKDYRPNEGNHIGYTTHSVEAGEVVEIVRKYGQMSQNQIETMSYQAPNEDENIENLTVKELKRRLDEKEIEYNSKANKEELIRLLEGD